MKPKLTHIVESRRPGDFNAFAHCGRRVSWMFTVNTDEGATCEKCIVNFLVAESAVEKV